jgi:hypothetical protein
MGFDSLGYLNQQTDRCAPQKGLPTVLVKKERKKSKEEQAKAFRSGVWERDKARCRATGKQLAKSGADYDRVGEVHHTLKRSTHPEDIYTVSLGILLSKTCHVLAETVCPNDPKHRLLEIDGPDDKGLPQTFTFRDVSGKVTKRRIG